MAGKIPHPETIHRGIKGPVSCWLAVSLFFLFTPLLPAQSGTQKVTPEDFEVPEEFLDAEAVMITDLGEMDFTLDRLVYRYVRRILIQDEAGLRWAQASILYQPQNREAINNVSARAYRLNAAGLVAVFPINKKTIRDRETADKVREISFSLPFAQVGDIIEYAYEISTYNFTSLRNWNFQREIPVLFSQYVLSAPTGYVFSHLVSGDATQIRKIESIREAPVYMQRQNANFGGLNSRLNTLAQTSTQYNNLEIYQATLQPATVKEAFSTRPEDYSLGIRFQLTKRAFGGRNPTLAFSNWEEINRYLARKNSFFRVAVPETEVLSDISRSNSRPGSRQLLAESLYRWVREEFTWNEEYGILAHKMNKVLLAKAGSGADLNLLLMAVLRQAGFRTGPVLIATRDQGRVEPLFPSLDQFNHVIVWVEIEGRSIFLDATEKDIPFGLLPVKDLNEIGFLVTREEGRWIRVAPDNTREKRTVCQMDLLTDGRLTGQVEIYLNAFTRLLEHTDDSLALHAEAEVRDKLVTGFIPDFLKINTLVNQDHPELPLTVTCSLQTRPLAQVPEGFMLLNPMLQLGLAANPLPEGERKTPIDLNFPIREFYLIGLRIPTGYEVVSTPSPIRVQMTDNAGFFTYNVMPSEGVIHVSSVFLINRTHYLPVEYEGLRQFFQLMVEKQNESIVLRKVAVTP